MATAAILNFCQPPKLPYPTWLLSVDFFKMAAVAMETAKMLKN
jgi:hypothetical protein